MGMREAFDKWLQGRVFALEAKSPGEWMLIGATWACEWQKQKDADICLAESDRTWGNDDYADAIINQGK